jgi:hypothetical protein
MSFHDYCLLEGSTPAPVDALQGAACNPFDELVFRNALRRAERFGDPLLLSEFGATDDLGVIGRMVDRADRNFVSWQYWHYCQCADPTTSGGGPTQALVLDPARPPSGANLRTAKLETLSRPYPQALAGVPDRLRFDDGSRRFELDFAARRAGGGGFRFGADSQLHVPRRRYPGGYDVRVSGGEALSAANHQLLRIRTCAGRSRIGIVVVPGSGRRTADCRARRAPAARLRVSVRPRLVRAGRRVRYVIRVTVRSRGRTRAVRRARVTFGGRVARTDRRGRARVTLRLRRAGRHRLRATRPGLRAGAAVVRVRR